MSHRAGVLMGAALMAISGCSSAQAPAERRSPGPVAGEQTEVIVMGMIHGRHSHSSLYGIAEIQALVARIDPDFVLAEIPPDRFPAAAAQFRSTGSITEDRVRRFPEYVDAIFPLSQSRGFEIVPCAAWTRTMADNRASKLEAWRTERPGKTAKVDAAIARAESEIAAGGRPDDPRWIHTPTYDAIVKRGMAPYDRHFDRDLGQGGWSAINAAHYRLIEAAIAERGPGKRFLITFGAWHKHWFLEALQKRTDLRVRSVLEFLDATASQP